MVFKGDKHVNAVKEIPKFSETCRIITLIRNTKYNKNGLFLIDSTTIYLNTFAHLK